MKTLKEHLQALLDTRESKREEMKKLTEKTIEENRTMDGAEAEQFEKLRGEIKKLDDEITRLKEVQEMDAKTAAPVEAETKAAPQSTVPYSGSIAAQPKEKLEPGIGFARAARCLALGFLEHRNPAEIAAERYGQNSSIAKTATHLTTKAVDPARTYNQTWAGALVRDANVQAFLEYLRPRTLVGQFGQNGIPGMRRVPFRSEIIVQTRAPYAWWTAEGAQKNVTDAGFSKTRLEAHKIASITVATMEMVRDSDPSIDELLRDELARAVIEQMDSTFLDPAANATSFRPASLLNGITATDAGGGVDADSVRSDVGLIMNKFIANRNQLGGAVFIMGSKLAYALAMMFTLGNREFPNVEISGGKLAGIPVIVSDYVPDGIVALVYAPGILYADGEVELAMSTEASLKMVNVSSEQAEFTSLWQNNLVAFRAEKRVTWMRGRNTFVEYLTGVKWGDPATP